MFLDVAIAAARGDLEVLATPTAACANQRQSWHLLEHDRPAAALELLLSVDPSACGSHGDRAQYHGLVALALHHTGDAPGAAVAVAVAQFRALWSRPDADLPIVLRLTAAGL